MKFSLPLLSLVTCSLLVAAPLSVEKIVVNSTAQEDSDLFVADSNATDDKTSYTQKSISTLSTQANMNPYTVIQFSPSVNFTPVDQTGSNEPSYHDPIRIRGKSQSGPGGVYMINSMPVSSNPGGGKQMLDMENVSSIDLYKGYLSVDKNIGFSSLIGKVDMDVLAPKQKAGATLSQTFGSDNFKRTFVRFDTGNIKDFRAFGSISFLDSDKTKGEGELQRTNAMLGLAYQPNSSFKAEIYAIQNHDTHNNYDSLSYAEATDLDTYFSKDFASSQPTTSNDTDYYDWNKQKFTTTAVLGDIEYKPSSSDTLTLKPYYKKDKGEYWFSKASKSVVMNWQMDHDLYGAVAEYKHVFSQALKSKIGYWYHKQLPPGPPTDQKKYKVVNGDLVYKGYGVLSDADYHTLQTPYLELSGDLSKFHYSAGLQYQTFTIGSIKNYIGTSAATSTDHGTAISTSTYDSWGSVDAKTFETFLPSLYFAYDLQEDSSLYIDYSRTYGFDVNLYPSYASNRAEFVAKGVKLQTLWDDLKLETSDNIDLGFKTLIGAISINPTLFVSFVNNKQATVYDTNYGVSYPANVGDAFGYGAEFAANGPITENLEFLFSASYNKYAFTQNFQSSATTSSDIKGNQLPDAPEIMAKGAISYYLDRKWTFTPSLRYTSSRYGDVANTQKISAFTIADMDIAYKPDVFMGSNNAVFRLTATNLTNEKYIATIISADNALAADGTASTYQTGAPFGVYLSLNLKY